MGLWGVSLSAGVGPVHAGSDRHGQLRFRVPYDREGQGLYLSLVPEAVREGLKRRVSADVAYDLARHDALTEREIEVLKLIAAGFSNKLVAERLSITEDTVKGHVRNI